MSKSRSLMTRRTAQMVRTYSRLAVALAISAGATLIAASYFRQDAALVASLALVGASVTFALLAVIASSAHGRFKMRLDRNGLDLATEVHRLRENRRALDREDKRVKK